MNKSRLNILAIAGFFAVLMTIALSLPYPWCGLSSWLENLITRQNFCGCLCPWWIFVLGQIISSYFLFLLAQSVKKHSRFKYIVLQFIIGTIFFIFHLIAHNYYVEGSVYDSSVFCPWMWLIGLVLAIIFSLLPIYKGKELNK